MAADCPAESHHGDTERTEKAFDHPRPALATETQRPPRSPSRVALSLRAEPIRLRSGQAPRSRGTSLGLPRAHREMPRQARHDRASGPDLTTENTESREEHTERSSSASRPQSHRGDANACTMVQHSTECWNIAGRPEWAWVPAFGEPSPRRWSNILQNVGIWPGAPSGHGCLPLVCRRLSDGPTFYRMLEYSRAPRVGMGACCRFRKFWHPLFRKFWHLGYQDFR